MSAAKHTPGPWRLEEVVDRTIRHFCPVAEKDDFSLLTVVHVGGYGEDECVPFAAVFNDADARLIAAAPDLLAALELLLLSGDVRDAAEKAALTQARAAIAKATGGDA